jgi:hypothetical protein
MRSSEQVIDADFDPVTSARNVALSDVALVGVGDVAQRLQTLTEKA